jgi:hypothetical protein
MPGECYHASMPATPSDDRFREVFNLVERYIERRYGVPVVITDVPNPFTGDLDGAEIRVDYALTPEEAAFIIVHLFGHTVQWNVSARARIIGVMPISSPSEELLAELQAYEREAAQYSLQLFHDAGVHDLDQWLSDFAACDFAYLRFFYTSGEKRPFKSFWANGAPVLEPLAIPDFQPKRWRSRADGVVV